MKQWLLLLICVSITVSSKGQLSINYTVKEMTHFRMDDIWNFTLTNSLPEKQNIYIYTQILSDQGTVLAEARTQQINLGLGLTAFNVLSIDNANYSYNDKGFKNGLSNDGKFPAGEYDICITVFSSSEDIELTKVCNRVIVVGIGGAVNKETILNTAQLPTKNKIPKRKIF